MKSDLFKINLVYAILLHILVFIAVYFGWLGPMAGAGAEFCEAARDGIIKQPSNTFSNLSFAIFGLIAAFQISNNKFKTKNAITTNNSISLFFLLMMISMSAGSL